MKVKAHMDACFTLIPGCLIEEVPKLWGTPPGGEIGPLVGASLLYERHLF
jgi:hypothetical protein